MPENRLSQMNDLAVQYILDPNPPIGALPRTLAQGWPDAAALEVGLAMTEACHGIEQMYSALPGLSERVIQGWRLAALIGGEVLVLQRRGLADVRARDLMQLWSSA
ncbi:MAG: hypothetical protein ACK4HW_08290 [Roseinatronobacter sp.]